MTTTVKVSVGGRYQATVTQDGKAPVVVKGGEGERSFSLGNNNVSTFQIAEEQLPQEQRGQAEEADDSDEGDDTE